ncbi:hypothetical protein NDU88_001786 [Pleurodeles waltl]|uniref:Uncharacterized protein n=1 Tax=Pleurodeles waltl TaxID=8319 RepID=A0AAV7TIS6_PLEWA|nr:hypothetical protein NDU88_001786 [Pleurodeles waltl]
MTSPGLGVRGLVVAAAWPRGLDGSVGPGPLELESLLAAGSLVLCGMGKAEQRQAKLSFDGGRRKGDTPGPPTGEAQMEVGASDASVQSMFLDLKSSLVGIDAKLDHLTEQMDHIRVRHNLDAAQAYFSEISLL